MECLICIADSKAVVEYQCKHKICITCGIRLIFLYNNPNCPLCKQKSSKPVIKILGSKDNQAEYIEDKNVVYQNEECRSKVRGILVLKCKECSYKAKSRYDLNKHYKSHSLFLCNECFENKKEFWWELKTYKVADLKSHKNGKLNENGFKGHVFCVHCNIFLYDERTAIRHCNLTHLQCTICDILGSKYKYYSSFKDLEQHYRNFHYCCTNKLCIQNKCYAFPYKTELLEHLTRFHKENVKFSDIKKQDCCDVAVMDPCFKFNQEIQNRRTIKSNVIDKNMRDYSAIRSTLASSTSAIPDYLNRSIITKMNLNQNTRKAVVSRYTSTNKDEVHKIIESTISKDKTIEDCFDQVSQLITPEVSLKLFKEINFETIQPEVNEKYKEFRKNILFPKFESSIKSPSTKKIETRSIGFKILDLKKGKK
ncbi:E3 ubiquitin-protein ligase hel2 [Nosema granulosis]|uniref:E3 ubiquitin-protein ligase hel2 n=1 Tax=Nosema granulosis TaxID=83296 RepID=A0A9P6H216_9MICR|nr:E3 ubiquitin-protein ligase hel2 [Nosema granulosis]